MPFTSQPPASKLRAASFAKPASMRVCPAEPSGSSGPQTSNLRFGSIPPDASHPIAPGTLLVTIRLPLRLKPSRTYSEINSIIKAYDV